MNIAKRIILIINDALDNFSEKRADWERKRAISAGGRLYAQSWNVLQARAKDKDWFGSFPDMTVAFKKDLDVLTDTDAPLWAQVIAVGKILVTVAGTSFGLMHKEIRLGQMQAEHATRTARFGIGEFQELFRRYPDDPSKWTDDLRDLGYSEERIKFIKNLAQTLPPPDVLTQYQWRKGFKWPHYRAWMKVLGFRDWALDIFEELSHRIPPIQDIIHMGVREAFDDGLAAEYGTDQDYPPEFGEYAEKQGFDAAWAQKYWRSHWELPSVGNAFEMLHRRVISEEQLDTLLRVQDIMPYWRGKLKAIAYSPFTRVDVRRMRKVGVIGTYEELVLAYRDIGFDVDKATKMADFTEAFNTEEQRELTKSEIATALNKGYISPEEAKPLFAELGFTTQDVNFLVGSITYQKAQAKRDLSVGSVKTGYLRADKGGGWATDKLTALGYSADNALDLISTWDAERVETVLRPTKADILSWVKSGVITPQVAFSELTDKGFTAQNADRYLLAAGFDPEKSYQPTTPKELT